MIKNSEGVQLRLATTNQVNNSRLSIKTSSCGEEDNKSTQRHTPKDENQTTDESFCCISSLFSYKRNN
jgi:hypothetical protein